jgi:hypothetical protein
MSKKLNAIILVVLIVICTAFSSRADSKIDDALLSEMMAAEMFSFGIEVMIFEAKSEFASRNDVYVFFRQGFGPSLSEKLTANIWSGKQVKLKDGDQIMESPDNVYFKSIKPSKAVISFETPEHRKHIWGNSKLTELVLKKEDGRWKLFRKQ